MCTASNLVYMLQELDVVTVCFLGFLPMPHSDNALEFLTMAVNCWNMTYISNASVKNQKIKNLKKIICSSMHKTVWNSSQHANDLTFYIKHSVGFKIRHALRSIMPNILYHFNLLAYISSSTVVSHLTWTFGNRIHAMELSNFKRTWILFPVIILKFFKKRSVKKC